MSSCAYLLGTTVPVPGSDQTNFVVLGTFLDKESAKAAVSNMAPAIMRDQYQNGVSLYKLDHEKSKLYTFQKKDLEQAYTDIQKQQQKQLESQVEQLQQQQEQLQKQIENLKSGNPVSAMPGNILPQPPLPPTPTPAPVQ